MIANRTNMRDLRQWVCWRQEERDGKPTKIPYSSVTWKRASSNNSETWAGYEEAVSQLKAHSCVYDK